MVAGSSRLQVVLLHYLHLSPSIRKTSSSVCSAGDFKRQEPEHVSSCLQKNAAGTREGILPEAGPRLHLPDDRLASQTLQENGETAHRCNALMTWEMRDCYVQNEWNGDGEGIPNTLLSKSRYI